MENGVTKMDKTPAPESAIHHKGLAGRFHRRTL